MESLPLIVGQAVKLTRSYNRLTPTLFPGNYEILNGLGFNKEQTKLYWNDLTRRVVHKFDFNLKRGTPGKA